MYTLSLPHLGLCLLALSSLTFAHPEDDEIAHPYDLARRQLEANSRHAATSKCARQIAEYNSARRMKRSLSTGITKEDVQEIPGSSYEVPEKEQPTYKTIQNNTCIVAPEVTEGPYFVQNEFLRNDLREDQPGVDLFLDIEPWSKSGPATPPASTRASLPRLPHWLNLSPPQPLPASTDPLFTNSATRSAIVKSELENTTGDKTDELTWLRGAYPTNDNGLVEFKTKYPGYYTGRAIHIHTIVTTNWTYLTNGTVVSKSGNTRHIGQIFFDEELSDQVLATPAYQNSTQIRLENYRDAILSVQNSHGHNAFVDPVMVGETVEDGVLAYISE
ncbi:hypothetical protein RSAG8_12068, partial [Rhizoctonia solani AG-8 WAC10335]